VNTTATLLILRQRPSSIFFSYRYAHHRDLHSFPTRRSSDLFLTHVFFCVSKNVSVSCAYTQGKREQFSGFNRTLDAINNVYLASTDRKSGSAGMPRPISYAVFCLKKKTRQPREAGSARDLLKRILPHVRELTR